MGCQTSTGQDILEIISVLLEDTDLLKRFVQGEDDEFVPLGEPVATPTPTLRNFAKRVLDAITYFQQQLALVEDPFRLDSYAFNVRRSLVVQEFIPAGTTIVIPVTYYPTRHILLVMYRGEVLTPQLQGDWNPGERQYQEIGIGEVPVGMQGTSLDMANFPSNQIKVSFDLEVGSVLDCWVVASNLVREMAEIINMKEISVQAAEHAEEQATIATEEREFIQDLIGETILELGVANARIVFRATQDYGVGDFLTFPQGFKYYPKRDVLFVTYKGQICTPYKSLNGVDPDSDAWGYAEVGSDPLSQVDQIQLNFPVQLGDPFDVMCWASAVGRNIDAIAQLAEEAKVAANTVLLASQSVWNKADKYYLTPPATTVKPLRELQVNDTLAALDLTSAMLPGGSEYSARITFTDGTYLSFESDPSGQGYQRFSLKSAEDVILDLLYSSDAGWLSTGMFPLTPNRTVATALPTTVPSGPCLWDAVLSASSIQVPVDPYYNYVNKPNRNELQSVLTDASYAATLQTVYVVLSKYDALTKLASSTQRTFPLASASNPGAMPRESFLALSQALLDIAALQAQGGRYIGIGFATKADLDAYVIPATVNIGDFTYVEVDDAPHAGETSRYICIDDGTGTGTKTWGYAYKINEAPIGLVTDTTPGLVANVDADADPPLNGKVYFEQDGTGSVLGWDDHETRITNNTTAITDLTADFEQHVDDMDALISVPNAPNTLVKRDADGTVHVGVQTTIDAVDTAVRYDTFGGWKPLPFTDILSVTGWLAPENLCGTWYKVPTDGTVSNMPDATLTGPCFVRSSSNDVVGALPANTDFLLEVEYPVTGQMFRTMYDSATSTWSAWIQSGGGGGGSVNTVNGVGPDADKEVTLTFFVTGAQFDILKNSAPSGLVPGAKYIVTDRDVPPAQGLDSIPVGMCVWDFSGVSNPAYLDLGYDHGLLLRSKYPAIWDLITKMDAAKVLTDADWLAERAANAALMEGMDVGCAKYSTGDGTTTMRIPFIQDRGNLTVGGSAGGVGTFDPDTLRTLISNAGLGGGDQGVGNGLERDPDHTGSSLFGSGSRGLFYTRINSALLGHHFAGTTTHGPQFVARLLMKVLDTSVAVLAPRPTGEEDAGKVLTVQSDGSLAWDEGGGQPLLTITDTPFDTVMPGYLSVSIDNGILSGDPDQTDYPAYPAAFQELLVKQAAGEANILTMAAYAAELASNNGCCRSFGLDAENMLFRVPCIPTGFWYGQTMMGERIQVMATPANPNSISIPLYFGTMTEDVCAVLRIVASGNYGIVHCWVDDQLHSERVVPGGTVINMFVYLRAGQKVRFMGGTVLAGNGSVSSAIVDGDTQTWGEGLSFHKTTSPLRDHQIKMFGRVTKQVAQDVSQLVLIKSNKGGSFPANNYVELPMTASGEGRQSPGDGYILWVHYSNGADTPLLACGQLGISTYLPTSLGWNVSLPIAKGSSYALVYNTLRGGSTPDLVRFIPAIDGANPTDPDIGQSKVPGVEYNTGRTYFDGKPIFEKTYQFTNISVSAAIANQSVIETDFALTKILMGIDPTRSSATFVRSDATIYCPFGNGIADSSNIGFDVRTVVGDNLVIILSPGGRAAVVSGYATVFYTKK